VQTKTRSVGTTPWLDILRRATDGDASAISLIRNVVHGFLHRYRAYDVGGEWEDIWQDVACVLFDPERARQIRGHYAFVNYTGKVTFYTLLATRRALRKHDHDDLDVVAL
jgi:hypothetical protein